VCSASRGEFLCYLLLGMAAKCSKSAAHVAVDLQCWYTVYISKADLRDVEGHR